MGEIEEPTCVVANPFFCIACPVCKRCGLNRRSYYVQIQYINACTPVGHETFTAVVFRETTPAYSCELLSTPLLNISSLARVVVPK